ncbi:hypothetical protein [Streptomyces sp. CB03238]|uniref:hypothetical protein n=1 Tax=Streptomyces sp. CB03238 TaxID=1907777 RepID=UPI000A0F6068|nr:hypothetical protein [Streptomyces sp. CB03238]ORT58150.1 hypothetical protein BKD26_19810 [Streptomyces sp. CB03238]
MSTVIHTLVRPPLPEGMEPLTEQEKRVLELSALGHSNSEIGAETGLGKWRLPPVLEHLTSKLGVRGCAARGCRPAMVYIAMVNDIVDLPKPDDPGPLLEDEMAYLRALAAGRTFKAHAEVYGMNVTEADHLSARVRQRLGMPRTAAHAVYLASSRLL